MAEITGIISDLYTAGQALQNLARETRVWRRLSDRLFDIRESLEAAELTFESWQRKYDIQAHRPILYMQALFGKQGCGRIQATLGSINIVTRTIKGDINRMIGPSLRIRSMRIPPEEFDNAINEELVKDCFRRIRQNTSWSRKFVLCVLSSADDLEMRIGRLYRKLTMLERFSYFYLEKEHPYIFSEIKRLPGRRVILKVGDGRMEKVQKKLLDALAACKDAELLHRASGQDYQVHIGLSVPQIHKRDFAFLLGLNGRTHEVLVRPVRIKTNNPSRDFCTTLPALVSNPHDTCYMLPSSSTSAGFQVSVPPTNLLSDLEHKDSLSTIIRSQDTFLGSQILYPQDQAAIASGVAQSCFRLIGSQWLHCLDCTNIRWRRTREGNWTSMLTAAPGNASITRTLEQCLLANCKNRDHRDLSKHIQIFRIGLVIAELMLKMPMSYIDYDSTTNTMRLYINDGEEVDATEIAAEVERKSNMLLGNMVFFCLNALQDRDAMADNSIEGAYSKDVFKEAERLDASLTADRRRDIRPAGQTGRSSAVF